MAVPTLQFAFVWNSTSHEVHIDPTLPNFFDEKNYCFDGLRGTRDTVSRQLREDDVGSSVKHAEVITYKEEDQLWDR